MSTATLEQATDEVAQGNKPVETFDAGWISVAVYRNQGKNGPFYSYVPQRAYKVDEETRRTNSFTGDEALVVSAVDEQLLGVAVATGGKVRCQFGPARKGYSVY